MIDESAATAIAKDLSKTPSKGNLKETIMTMIAKTGDESMAEELIGGFEKMPMSEGKFNTLNSLGVYLGALKDIDKVKRGVDAIVKFRDAVPEGFKNQTDPFINGLILQGLITKKEGMLKENPDDTKLKELIEYIKSKLPGADKKGF